MKTVKLSDRETPREDQTGRHEDLAFASAESAGGKETLARAAKISSGGPPVIMIAEEDTFTL